MLKLIFFLFSVRLLQLLIGGSSAASCPPCPQSDPAVAKERLNNDFEINGVFPWVDESQIGVRWQIENKTSPWELGNVAPQPLTGRNYLRVHRGQSFSSFGVAILRSQTFRLPACQNDFSFSFWIRSKWPQFTNLELYMSNNGNERLLISLYNYSSITNGIWRSQSVLLEGESASNVSLVFYAYCGTEKEDAVAIDDLRFSSKQLTVTSPFWTTTSKSPTTKSAGKLLTEPTTEPQNTYTTDTMTDPTTDPTTQTTPSTITPTTTTNRTTTTTQTTPSMTTPTTTTNPTTQTTPSTTTSIEPCSCPTVEPCY